MFLPKFSLPVLAPLVAPGKISFNSTPDFRRSPRLPRPTKNLAIINVNSFRRLPRLLRPAKNQQSNYSTSSVGSRAHSARPNFSKIIQIFSPSAHSARRKNLANSQAARLPHPAKIWRTKRPNFSTARLPRPAKILANKHQNRSAARLPRQAKIWQTNARNLPPRAHSARPKFGEKVSESLVCRA